MKNSDFVMAVINFALAGGNIGVAIRDHSIGHVFVGVMAFFLGVFLYRRSKREKTYYILA